MMWAIIICTTLYVIIALVLLLPGGVMNPDYLRQNQKAVRFVKQFFESGKPIAAICHGPWLLVEAGVVRGRTVTSWPSLQTDIRNAGGDWVDREVATDMGLVTSRKPDDIPAFNRKMIEEFAEGIHTARRADRKPCADSCDRARIKNTGPPWHGGPVFFQNTGEDQSPATGPGSGTPCATGSAAFARRITTAARSSSIV